MTPAELLTEAYGRIPAAVEQVLDGLDADQLVWRPTPDANPIGWLIWHLLRVQDDHVARAVGSEQVWTAQGFARRFDLPYEDEAIGYGQSTEEVGHLRVEAPLLGAYAAAVHARTAEVLAGLSAEDLDRVVDEDWDPPVTLGARLVSVLDDDAKHLGQAEYVKGLLPA